MHRALFLAAILAAPSVLGQQPVHEARRTDAATPILDHYRRVAGVLDAEEITAHLKDADSAKRDAALRAHKAAVDELAALCAQEPERLDDTRWGALCDILRADADRARDDHDDKSAYARILALARLSETLARSPILEKESAAASLAATLKLCAMLDSGSAAPAPAELKALFARWADFHAEDFARAWAAQARERAKATRAAYAVPGGPEKLGARIDEQGVAPGAAAAAAKAAGDDLARRMGDAGVLIQQDAESVRRLPPSQIASEISAAEAIIPKLQGVLALNDPSLTLPQIGGALSHTRSRVARLIVGSPWTELYLARLRADEGAKAMEKLR